MDVTLVSMVGCRSYTCSHGEWGEIVRIAEGAGWEPSGTLIDFDFEFELQCDEGCTFADKLFITLSIHHRRLMWDGDYLSPENQVVTDNDVGDMLFALMSAPVDSAFIDFLSNGSFRITSGLQFVPGGI
jgi:hypothetical protein